MFAHFILLIFLSLDNPLLFSAGNGHLEICRLLVESNADVAAKSMSFSRCFSHPHSHHLLLTICLAALAALHSNAPSTTTKPTSLHTCAASAFVNEAPPRAAAAEIKNTDSLHVRVSGNFPLFGGIPAKKYY